MPTSSLGQRLKHYRIQANLSQKAVAEALNVSDSAISKYEKDKRHLTPEMLKQFAGLYGVSLDTLLDVESSAHEDKVPITIKAPYKTPTSKTTIVFGGGLYLGLMLMLLGFFDIALWLIIVFAFVLMGYQMYHFFLHEGRITSLKLVDKTAKLSYRFDEDKPREKYLNELLLLSFFVFLSALIMVMFILPLTTDFSDPYDLFLAMILLNLHLGYMVYVWYKRSLKKFLPKDLRHYDVNHRLNTYKWLVFHWLHDITLIYFVLMLGYTFSETTIQFTFNEQLFFISTIGFYFIFTKRFIYINNLAHHAYVLTVTGQNGQTSDKSSSDLQT